jgi:hypothetical protein
VNFVDDDGSIIVPKSVRPIIDYPETILGTRSGALKQFRAGKLHIRDYGSYYSVHSDKINPSDDPLGHLIVDAPEYLVGIFSGIYTYSMVKRKIKMNSKMSNSNLDSLIEPNNRNQLSPYIAGIIASYSSHTFVNLLKDWFKGESKLWKT